MDILSSCSLCLFCFVCFAADADASTSECPTIALKSKHFTKIHGRTCYLFVNEEKFWKEARSACWNMGGEMLSIKDSKTMQFIQSALNSQLLGRFDRVWLGAMYHRGTWRWTTGKTVKNKTCSMLLVFLSTSSMYTSRTLHDILLAYFTDIKTLSKTVTCLCDSSLWNQNESYR